MNGRITTVVALGLLLTAAPQVLATQETVERPFEEAAFEFVPGNIDDPRLEPVGWTQGVPGAVPAPLPATLHQMGDLDAEEPVETQSHTGSDGECQVAVSPGPEAACYDQWDQSGTARPSAHNHFHNLIVSGTAAVGWFDAWGRLVYRYDCFWYAVKVLCLTQSASFYVAGTQTMVVKGDVRPLAGWVDDCRLLDGGCLLHGTINV